ncbi:MAG TPA: delta-60 repeat domain-containing protein [Verrucomicrobiota bacterium]|nr:delta-60 repeat domain-containing protein [Verrucomicrobiota bacterium]
MGGDAGEVYAMALQTDGKTILAGNFASVGSVTRLGVARLLPGGEVDVGFNAGAIDGPVYAVATAVFHRRRTHKSIH